MDSVTFLASFPAIMSAIKVTGDGNGMRVQLEIPESEMANAVHLLKWRKQVLKVTIGPESQEISALEGDKHKNEQAQVRPQADERSTRSTLNVDGGGLRYAANSPLGR